MRQFTIFNTVFIQFLLATIHVILDLKFPSGHPAECADREPPETSRDDRSAKTGPDKLKT